MTDALNRERQAAQRFLEARRHPGAFDQWCIDEAHRRAASQPRGDNTIIELPLLGTVLSSDLIPVFHNGQTYGALASSLATVAPVATTVYNVKNYGAKGDGITDDTAAVNLAISAITAPGGVLYFPGGTYMMNNVSTPNTSSIDYYVRGDGIDVTILKGNSTTDHVFSLRANGSVQDMTVDGNSMTTNGLACGTNNPVGIDRMVISNVKARNIYTGGGRQGWVFVATGDQAAPITQVSTLIMSQMIIEGPSHPGQDALGISNVDTTFVLNSIIRNVGRTPNFFFGNKLFINGLSCTNITGGSIANSLVIDSFMLYAHVSNLYMDSTCNPPIFESPNMKFTNCTFLNNVQFGSPGNTTPSTVQMNNCEIAGQILFYDANGVVNPSRFVMHGCRVTPGLGSGGIFYNKQGGSPSFTGFYIFGNVMDTTNCAGGFFTSDNAATLSASAVIGNYVVGAKAATFNNTTFGSDVTIRANRGTNPIGVVASPAVPATTVFVANTTGYDVTVFVTAGTGGVSAIKVGGTAGGSSGGAITGQVLAANAQASVPLPAGQTIALTYPSGTPTWVWVN